MKHTAGRWLALLLSLALLLGLSPTALAAGTEEEGPALTGVMLNHSTMSMAVGQSDTLSATLQMSDGSTLETLPTGYTAVWTVANDRGDEVRVTADGENNLTATVEALALADTNEPVKAVSVTITVTPAGAAQGQQASCQVTVSAAEPPGVTVSPKTMELSPIETAANHTGRLAATVTPASAPQTVAWTSGDGTVATVSDTGVVTAVGAGETKITATANGYQDTCTVQVQGVALDTSEVTKPLRVGGNATLDATIYGSSLQNKTLSWSSSDSTVVKVDKGYLYAMEEGEAIITVQINGTTYVDSVTVKVEQATADVIRASAQTGDPLEFSELESDLQSQSRQVLDKSLSYVSGLSVDTAQGTLYYRYASDGDTGSGVGTGERYYVSPGNGQMSLSDLTFVPKSDFEGTAVIRYTGYASGSEFFQGTIQVSVEMEQDVTYSTSADKAVQFSAADFAQVCRSRTGRDLSYIIFTLPDSSRGTLYYNYLSAQNPGTAVAADGQYKYTGSPNLGDVYFLPAQGTSGEVVFPYTAWDVNGTSYRGRVTVQVSAAVASGDLTYSVARNGRVTFDDSDFNTLSRNLTGYSLERVRFTLPDSDKGTLYYGYTSSGSYTAEVSETRDYYRSSYPYLDNITFVAGTDYTGTVSIPFTAWDVEGNRFYGEVGISVAARGSGTIRYTVLQGGTVKLDDGDFNDLCQELTGGSLRYVRFTLPASSRGTLYYKYTSSGNYESKVSESRSYYRSSSPYLDNITFVPASSYTGTVSIPFTGWNTSSETFAGTLEITVDSTPDPLVYQVTGGDALTFDEEAFDDYCRLATGEGLRYVRFTLPTSTQGTLYYNYRTSTGKYDSKVTSSRNYYLSSSPYLEKVSFVPGDDYAGTFDLSFTGWSTGGRKFTGTVTITVTQGQAGNITYSTAYQPVTLQAEDFVQACAQRGRGSLVSVKFTGADSLYGGYLYDSYGGIHSASSQVRTGTVYYPSSSPRISEVSFVPRVGFQGTVVLTYTGTDSRGGTYQGTVSIQVTPNTTSSHFSDLSGYGWAAAAVDFLYENQVVSGTGNGRYAPGQPITRAEFLVMLDRAFAFPATESKSFPDVPDTAYYAQSVRRGYALGVVSGYPDGTFRPNEVITRESAATMLYRAMQASGWSLSSAGESAMYGYSDWRSVSAYAVTPMATLVQNGLLTGDGQGKLLPTKTMTRAEMAVLLARALTF